MKKIIITIIFSIIALGCAGKKLTEREFSAIWQEFQRTEFEESFDEKQSVSQREKILSELLSGYKLNLNEFKSYMEEHHNDKYSKTFVE